MHFIRSLSLGSNSTAPHASMSLHDACREGAVARVEELLEQGADVHSRDENGRSPLECAIAAMTGTLTSRDLEVLGVLAAFGALANADCDAVLSTRDDIGTTVRAALHVCLTVWKDQHARGCSQTLIPVEVVWRGAQSTQTYLDTLKAAQPLRRRQICVVGPSKSGKTSLVRALAGEQPPKVGSEAFGVDICKWTFEATRGPEAALHELMLWDFAGGDGDEEAARRLAAVLMTRRCIRVMCVDAQALFDAAATVAAAPVESDAGKSAQPDALAEFVDSAVLPWVRELATDSLGGMVVLVLTKMDLVRDRDESTLEAAKIRVAERLHSQLKATTARQPLDIRWLAVSCESGDASEISNVRTQFEELIVTDGKSFLMPERYREVLGAIQEIRAQNAKVRKSDRAAHQIVPANKLIDLICTKHDVSTKVVPSILQTLHDMGDIFWCEDGPKPLRTVVMLDPQVFVDAARVVVQAARRDRNDEVMPHATLMGLALWNSIDDVATTALKQLLVMARLAFASRGEVEWDSDLIVPAYWKAHAAWQTPLRVPENSDVVAGTMPLKRVRWQYHFTGALPRDFFEKVLVESYSPLWGRTIARNGIVFETDDGSSKQDRADGSSDFVCQLVVNDAVPGQCVVHLSGVAYAKDAPSWWVFQYAAQAIETVLDSYGQDQEAFWVSRCALNDDDEPHRLETVVAYWDETSPAYRSTIPWLPPDLAWYSQIVAKRSEKAA